MPYVRATSSRPARWPELAIGAALLLAASAAPAQNARLLLCAGCHGMNGEGRAEAGYPRIAGQSAPYLQRQLEAYAAGLRKSAIMEPLARALGAEERAAIAGHFSSRRVPQEAVAAPRDSASGRGETLARVGDNERRLPACQNCHGAGGQGHPPYNPYLAGLSREYLRHELMAWRSGARRSDPSGNMASIAAGLSDADIDAVAAYYAALAPPARPEGRVAQGPGDGVVTQRPLRP